MSRSDRVRNLPAYRRGHALAIKLSTALKDRPWPEALHPLRNQLVGVGVRVPALIYAAAAADFHDYGLLSLQRALAYTADFQSLIKEAVDLGLITPQEYAEWDGDAEFIDAQLTAVAEHPFKREIPEGAEWDEDDLSWDA